MRFFNPLSEFPLGLIRIIVPTRPPRYPFANPSPPEGIAFLAVYRPRARHPRVTEAPALENRLVHHARISEMNVEGDRRRRRARTQAEARPAAERGQVATSRQSTVHGPWVRAAVAPIRENGRRGRRDNNIAGRCGLASPPKPRLSPATPWPPPHAEPGRDRPAATRQGAQARTAPPARVACKGRHHVGLDGGIIRAGRIEFHTDRDDPARDGAQILSRSVGVSPMLRADSLME
jgi:hypothetical protein